MNLPETANMRHFSLIALVSGLVYLGSASANTDVKRWPHEIIDAMDGQRLVLFLKDADIAASPPWHPAEDAKPPMTIAEALSRLKAWMAKDARYQGAVVHEIELKPIQEHEQENRWYFLFQLRKREGERIKARYVAVMFNGTIVPVLAEPEPIK